MRILRGAVIFGLMLALPAIAIHGDVGQLLFGSTEENVIAAPTGVPIASEVSVDRKVEREFEPPAVFPTYKSSSAVRSAAPSEESSQADIDASLGAGKRLRSAIYRPLAKGTLASIRRVPAKQRSTTFASTLGDTASVEELGKQLQALGARRYQMDQRADGYYFVCEFAPESASQKPVVFEAEASDRRSAMCDVLAQVQDWDRGVIR